MRVRAGLCIAVILGLALITVACGGDTASTTTVSDTSSTDLTLDSTSTTSAETLAYTAILEGSSAVPPVKTSSTGMVTLTVSADGSSVHYIVTISKLTNLTVARLREGVPGNSSGVIVTLYDGPTKSGPFNGTLVEGTFRAGDMGGPLKGKTIADLVELLESGRVFLNVGNSSHKGGALAGTLEPSASRAPTTTTLSSTTTASQSGGGTGGSQTLADLFGEFQQAKDFSLDFTMTSSGGQSTTGKMWSQAAKKMKIETTVNNEASVIIIDLTANTMTMYQPSTKQGVKTVANIAVQDPSSYADVNVNDVQDLGTETVNGETCRVVQYTTTSGSADGSTVTVKMWLSERLGFPVRVVTTTADGTVTTVDYSNIKVGAVPDSTFAVPSDVTITSMP